VPPDAAEIHAVDLFNRLSVSFSPPAAALAVRWRRHMANWCEDYPAVALVPFFTKRSTGKGTTRPAYGTRP
jgi:hypothetical protein